MHGHACTHTSPKGVTTVKSKSLICCIFLYFTAICCKIKKIVWIFGSGNENEQLI